MNCTTTDLKSIIADRGGVFSAGSHRDKYGEPHCPLCLLEAVSACRLACGEIEEMTDGPSLLGLPDIRLINDACWSSREVATPHLMRLVEAYWEWAEWSEDRRQRVVDRIVILTVQQIISKLPGLVDSVRRQCESAGTRAAAMAAAAEARGAAAGWAAEAARAAADVEVESAARVAWSAARVAWAAAMAAARDQTLITAVDLWIEAAQTQ